MSSPIGGFYLSALNRRQRDKFELSKRVKVRISLSLTRMDEELISTDCTISVGEGLEVNRDNYSVKVETKLLASGLLNAVCFIYCSGEMSQQEFNLSPNESTTSTLAANSNMKITLFAKPCD